MSIQYPHLKSLKILGKEWATITISSWSSIAGFINANPTSTTIQLTASNTTELPIRIWDTIKKNTSVKALRLDRVKIDASQAESFWKACTVLEKLEMNHCMISNPWAEDNIDSRPLPAFSPLIQEISLTNLGGIDERGKLQLVAMCPRLRSLCWNGTGFPIIQFGSANNLEISLPNLDELDLEGEASSDEVIFFIIRDRKPLKKLAIPVFTSGAFGLANLYRLTELECLERHFPTIQDLDFAHSTSGSKEPLKILSSCPLDKLQGKRHLGIRYPAERDLGVRGSIVDVACLYRAGATSSRGGIKTCICMSFKTNIAGGT
ncbi:hypothetical protein BGX26_011253 [Mortierella sp. AD094]|nr:hypothetical protein BGX26_011253 [Mortierella sp. AD094]